jgi:hypothetical protein
MSRILNIRNSRRITCPFYDIDRIPGLQVIKHSRQCGRCSAYTHPHFSGQFRCSLCAHNRARLAAAAAARRILAAAAAVLRHDFPARKPENRDPASSHTPIICQRARFQPGRLILWHSDWRCALRMRCAARSVEFDFLPGPDFRAARKAAAAIFGDHDFHSFTSAFSNAAAQSRAAAARSPLSQLSTTALHAASRAGTAAIFVAFSALKTLAIPIACPTPACSAFG